MLAWPVGASSTERDEQGRGIRRGDEDTPRCSLVYDQEYYGRFWIWALLAPSASLDVLCILPLIDRLARTCLTTKKRHACAGI